MQKFCFLVMFSNSQVWCVVNVIFLQVHGERLNPLCEQRAHQRLGTANAPRWQQLRAWQQRLWELRTGISLDTHGLSSIFFFFFYTGKLEKAVLAKHSDKYTLKATFPVWIHKQCLLLLKMSFFLNSRRVLIITTQQRSTVLPCSLTLKALRIMVRLNLMFLHT